MWRADLVRTRTGQVGRRLDFRPGATAPNDETNGVPAASIVLRRSDVETIKPGWLDEWRNSVVLSHRYTDNEPWVAIIGGPITGVPKSTEAGVEVAFSGIQEVFKHRYLVHEWTDYAYTPGQPSTTGIEAWKRGGPWWEGSLGQIAWNIVQMAQAKPGGGLPIVHGTPDERITDATRHGRGASNWDLGNLEVWGQVLLGLADDDGGPDLRFTPYWAGPRRIAWRFEHGTHNDPRVAHAYRLRLDGQAAESPITDVEVTTSGHSIAHRVYGTGAGEGPGTEVRVAEDFKLIADDMPLLEAVASDTNRTAWRDVLALAQGRVHGAGVQDWQIACTIATSPARPLWQVRPGAPVRIRVRDRFPFPETWQEGRILKAKYDPTSDRVGVEIEGAGL